MCNPHPDPLPKGEGTAAIFNTNLMSMKVIHRLKKNEFIIIPYKRPKWDRMHYACNPVEIVPADQIEVEVFKRLGVDLLEDKVGIDPESRREFTLTLDEERRFLTDAKVINLGAKGILGGFAADVAKFTPCTIKQRRLHKVPDIDPALNIEVNYPMSFDEFVKAFRLAFERAE
jgi:hypothetical protein